MDGWKAQMHALPLFLYQRPTYNGRVCGRNLWGQSAERADLQASKRIVMGWSRGSNPVVLYRDLPKCRQLLKLAYASQAQRQAHTNWLPVIQTLAASDSNT